MTTVVVEAELPDSKTTDEFLNWVTLFDKGNANCRFRIGVSAPDQTVPEAISMLEALGLVIRYAGPGK